MARPKMKYEQVYDALLHLLHGQMMSDVYRISVKASLARHEMTWQIFCRQVDDGLRGRRFQIFTRVEMW